MIAFLCVLAVASGWHFAGEHVVVDVRPREFVVHGTYRFVSPPGADALAILYPFPSDSTLEAPELLDARVSNGAAESELTVVSGEGGWRWLVVPGDSGESTVSIVYRQRMHGSAARYVLTSARKWSCPIDRACLEVRVPADVECRIDPPMPLRKISDGQKIYRREFIAFYPERDLVVRLGEELD